MNDSPTDGGHMNTPTTSITDEYIDVMPWQDTLIQNTGYPIGDPYIEMFWLPVLGPTATWLLRRLATGLEHEPAGYTVDVDELARGIGVAYSQGKHNPFARGLHRCIMFGVAQQIAVVPRTVIAVRTVLPSLSQRHIGRLPEQLQIAHSDWTSVRKNSHPSHSLVSSAP
jgi:hypothetical protein